MEIERLSYAADQARESRADNQVDEGVGQSGSTGERIGTIPTGGEEVRIRTARDKCADQGSTQEGDQSFWTADDWIVCRRPPSNQNAKSMIGKSKGGQ